MLIPPQWFDPRRKPMYEQIYRFYRDAVTERRLRPGDRLPSIRELARHLGVSRNPVEEAYARLAAEGYTAGKSKSSYTVAELEWLPPPDRTALDARERPEQPADPFPAPAPRIDFDYDRTDPAGFPLASWSRMTQLALRSAGNELLAYGPRQGELGLRERIAEYAGQNRGVRCEAGQIVITSGTQQALGLLAGLLRAAGTEAPERTTLAVEAYMHPGLLQTLRHHRLTPVPLPLDEDGLRTDALVRLTPQAAAYVTPSHQFPLGMLMPAPRRLQLLQWAQRTGAYVLEDDYDCDFLYEGRPLPALQGLDTLGCVAYLGTFSRSLAPGIRLGYVVLPPRLLACFEREYAFYDQTASRLTQKTLELFMANGSFERHVRRMRKRNQQKREMLLAEVERAFDGWGRLTGAPTGQHAVLELETDAPIDWLLRSAAGQGVRVQPVSAFRVETEAASKTPSADRRFLLGFGRLSAAEIREGVRRLASAWGGPPSG